MFRKKSLYAILMLLLFTLLSGLAGAEEIQPVPATPTDLSCTHEHTKTTIYFFDSPVYEPVNAESHRVSGLATVETVCLDCGEVLSSEVTIAEEIHPHSMKKDVCALCGFKVRSKAPAEKPADAPGEYTLIAREDGGADGLLTLTLTKADLMDLQSRNVSVVLVKGKGGDAAIALGVADALSQVREADADLLLQLAEQEDGSLFAGLFLAGPAGRKAPEDRGISLRFYRQSRADVRVSLAPAEKDTLIETQGEWNEKGYWSVPYLEEGTYFLLQ